MIKTSILVRKLDFASMGDLRDDIVADIERLEATEDALVAIRRECEKADEPTVDVVMVDCEIEWAIYFPEDDFWAGKSETVSHVRTTSFDEIIRFQSRTDAMRFKSERHLYLSSIPFPVPKLREAK